MEQQCTNCSKPYTETSKGQWWSCTNYFGLTGFFCPDCYEDISHDSYKNPRNPAAYMMMLLKLTGVK
jgi:hypothetical protein